MWAGLQVCPDANLTAIRCPIRRRQRLWKWAVSDALGGGGCERRRNQPSQETPTTTAILTSARNSASV